MIKRIVIIDLQDEQKVGPYDNFKVAAERAALKKEQSIFALTPVVYEQYEKTDSERTVLKAVKKEWNKIKTNFKERETLLNQILSAKTPNWGAVKVSFSLK